MNLARKGMETSKQDGNCNKKQETQPELTFNLQSMQQQFKRMQLIFRNLQGRMDRQEATIARIKRENQMKEGGISQISNLWEKMSQWVKRRI